MNHGEIKIAVLPLENLNEGSEAGILCKSFSIELITELSRFRQFQIIPLETASKLTSGDMMDHQLLDKLHPDYIVKGSFRTQDDDVRINAQLIDTPSHHLIWADRFEGNKNDIFHLQDHILREVVASLQTQLNQNLLSQVRQKPRTNLKAYECWVYGLHELKKGTLENDLKAREYFEQAIEIDPEYSLAYSGMSMTFFNEWSCQLWDRWDLSQNGSFEWAKKAIELDEQNYIAACVLGMVYTYRKLYGTSEHYLRRSLQLNSNDPDTLIQVAVSFLYHGFLEEAWDLYERALALNPSSTDQYCTIGSFILIEKGEFQEALALAARVKEVPFVDAHAYYAAAWMELGNGQKMKENWEIFLQMYTNKINGGKPARSEEAIQWMNQISPYQHKSRVEGLWEKLSHGKMTTRMDSPPSEIPPQSWRNTFSNQDGIWMIEYEGQNCQLPEVKGFFDLTKMLANPRTPFHCAELMGSSIDMEGTPVLDEKSKKAYQDKIVGLQKDIREAESHHDYGRSSQLQEEYQTLLDHLSSALNVKGQSRKKGHTVEKARSAVTWRIRHAIAKIEEVHPQLGKHLSNSIKTGTFCAYEPEKDIEWIV